ncbi:hypothetical protein [Pseudoalteromonas phenolica]|uniref:hypothetical protein n=1 Tax=Pseudoalteromonas phenolica TaxID=161398 RepID=UPI001486E630|nr:hypothetical protein [Pseudoalteromonas phenolica]
MALHTIAGYLNACNCKSLDDVEGALQELIITATDTQQQYKNGLAEQASSVPTTH